MTLKMENEEIRRENLELQIDIAEICSRKRRRKCVENILLVGKPGAGKSALINTLLKVVAGVYIPKAMVGSGATKSKTLTLNMYKSCGVLLEDISDDNHRDIFGDILKCLPNVYDMAGRKNTPDENTEGEEEILELIIGGYVNPGTSIEALERLQKEHGIGSLRTSILKDSKPEWKMTKIVFVQSCRDSVPVHLIELLDKIMRKSDPSTAHPLYTGDVFVVITKYDLVEEHNQYEGEPDQTDSISMEAFKRKEKEVARHFSIEGALDDNLIRWVSYTDRHKNKDNPFIDNIALKFLKRMLTNGNRSGHDVHVAPPVVTTRKLLELRARRYWKELNGCSLQLMLLLVVVVAFFYALLSAKLR